MYVAAVAPTSLDQENAVNLRADTARARPSRSDIPRSAHRRRVPRPLAVLTAAVLLATLTAPSTALAQAEEPVDRPALLELFIATDGDTWSRSDNWGSSLPLDRWYGVSTDSTGRVVSLALPSNGLFGTIPASIGSLTSLESLDLAGNDLYGQMPAQIGDLVNLTHLDLKSNRLDRQIPPEIGELVGLELLDLKHNLLFGAIPASRSLGSSGS